MKRAILITILSFFLHAAYSQRSIVELRSIVEEADSLSTKSQKIFYLYKIGPKNNSQKETWYYTMKNGRPVMFEVRYHKDSTELTEVYYMQNRQLVCSEEYETKYYTMNEDQIAYGNIRYYDNTLVKQVVTMGRSKYQSLADRSPYDIIERFRKRYAELEENIY
ncbi:MAG TPA: hypothetical protein VLC28_09100 [Flavitalea sp.]|nr:hypothetical protein [Flavitalea sp.]